MLGGNAVNLDAFSFLLMPSRLSRPLRGVQGAFGAFKAAQRRSRRLRRVQGAFGAFKAGARRLRFKAPSARSRPLCGVQGSRRRRRVQGRGAAFKMAPPGGLHGRKLCNLPVL